MKKFENLMAQAEANMQRLAGETAALVGRQRAQEVCNRVTEKLKHRGRGGFVRTATAQVVPRFDIKPPVEEGKPQPRLDAEIPDIDVAAIEAEVFGS